MAKSIELNDLERIFKSAVKRADPYEMLIHHMKIENNILIIDFGQERKLFNLADYDAIYALGTGKATARMARAVEEIFKGRLSGGIISVKYGHTEKLDIIETIEAGHPIPDENSLRAAKTMMETAKTFSDKTLVIHLISGGGSALLESLSQYEDQKEHIALTLDDLQKTTKTLLDCGAKIEEINCLRKHLSAIKGGQFARMLYPATTISLVLSDVVGDHLDTIASGLTTADSTTYGDALATITKYDLESKLPPAVVGIIRLGADHKLPETPKADDKIFPRVSNILIGTNYHSLVAASREAEALGYHPLILSSQLIGEAREAAKFFAGIARDVVRYGLLAKLPACIIAGGETTVTIRGDGKGGRNQEMALAFLSELEKRVTGDERIHFLSAATDGNDGPTDAAGAFASLEMLKRAEACPISIDEHLKKNNSYPFFERIDGLLKTGPTNTNVCDVQVLLIKG